MHKALIPLSIGGIVLFLSLAVALGGVDRAGQLLALSLLRTNGMALLIWMPLAMLGGWFVVAMGRLIGRRQKSTTVEKQDSRNAIASYLQQANSSGLSFEQAKKNLQRQGWPAEEIAEVHQADFDLHRTNE